MDIQELVRAQRAYFLSGATRPYAFRMEQLKKLQRALQTNEKLLEQAMYQDFRKAPMEVYMCETGMVLEEVRFHLKHLKGWMRERAVPTPLAQFHAKSFVSPEPYGVALIISPWNYPVQLCLSPLVGAISGGNCAIVKPVGLMPPRPARPSRSSSPRRLTHAISPLSRADARKTARCCRSASTPFSSPAASPSARS